LDLQIHGRNLEISAQIKEHVTDKLGLIDRHLPNIGRADVEIALEATRAQKDRVVVQVNVSGTLLRAQQRAANAKAAVNAVAQALDRQIKRYKGQVYRSEREARGALEFDAGADRATEEALAETELGRIGTLSRVKHFNMGSRPADAAAGPHLLHVSGF
jgi:ribosomal subunit interface protein